MPINVSFPKVATWAAGQAQWARLMETNFVSTAKQLDLIRTSIAQVKATANAVTKLGSVVALYWSGKPRYGFETSDGYFQIYRFAQGNIKLGSTIMIYQPPKNDDTGSDFRFVVGEKNETGGGGVSYGFKTDVIDILANHEARIYALEHP